MTNRIRGPLLGAAALALIAAAGRASCSKPAEERTTEQAGGAEQVAGQQVAPGKEVTEQNARALLKAMSDYLAAQKVISLSYDSVFEIVTDQKEKLQLATSGTILLSRPN